jgi:hypothetical protein
MVVVPVVITMVVCGVVRDRARVTWDVVGVRIRAHLVVSNLRSAFWQTVTRHVDTSRIRGDVAMIR